jgi:hypothetical protein
MLPYFDVHLILPYLAGLFVALIWQAYAVVLV